MSALLKFWPYLVIGLFTVGVIWVINSWRVEAGKVPLLESEISRLESTASAKRELSDKQEQPKNEADNETKTNDNVQLNACLAKLRGQGTCIPIRAVATANISKTGTDNLPAISSGKIAAHDIYCEHLTNEFNLVKKWAQDCIKQGLCK